MASGQRGPEFNEASGPCRRSSSEATATRACTTRRFCWRRSCFLAPRSIARRAVWQGRASWLLPCAGRASVAELLDPAAGHDLVPGAAGRLLTAARFKGLAEAPLELEWFANIDNKSTRRAYTNAPHSIQLGSN